MQSATPRPVQPSKPRRTFTLEEANKTLPLVGRIVRDIVDAHARGTELQELPESPEIQREIDLQSDHLQAYLEELKEIGCDLKDFEKGLIDFVGRHAGREVNLCWKLGEPKIEFWHETTDGFAGRQPVSTLQED